MEFGDDEIMNDEKAAWIILIFIFLLGVVIGLSIPSIFHFFFY